MSNIPPASISSKRLFTVAIETEVVVLAESSSEAELLARESMRDLDGDQWTMMASPMAYLPAGWEGDAIPYGPGDSEDPDRTVDKWIERGAAPKYTELLQKLGTGRMK
jgi:hypothetical protein